MKRPQLIYDGACGFCKRWVGRWQAVTGEAVEYLPSKEENPRSVVWLEGKDRAEGAEAAFRLLASGGRPGWLWTYRRVPPFAWVSERVYRLVADHRAAAARLDALFWGPRPSLPSYRASAALMIRVLGLVNVAAFASLWTQARGLFGARGILPIAEVAGAPLRYFPSVFHFGASDAALSAACAAGVLLGAAAALGFAAGPCLLACWALYLSFLNLGREFMSFQWDILLLEATFLAAVLAPWTLKPSFDRWRPSRAGLFLARLLLFKIMLESGLVKLMSGDPHWRDLTALTYHYETQPLPTWIGWYAHQLPLWWQKLSCVVMFAIELGVPLLIWIPRARLFAFGAFALLHVLIALTGNYNFFNLLTMALALTLVPGKEAPAVPSASWPRYAAFALIAAAAFLPSLSPLRLFEHYGLFAIMTTERDEIVLEGSEDGTKWLPYEFQWKPGDVTRRPRFVAPHQPRLDWQMWFAALGTCDQNQWLVRFQARLLEGSPAVSALLAKDPFEGGAPRYVRSSLWRYRFTRPGQPGWWTRERLGWYCPPFSAGPGSRSGPEPRP